MTAARCAIVDLKTCGGDATRPLHLSRAQGRGSDVARPVLLLHGSTLPGSIAYTTRFGGPSWLEDLAQRGFDAWALDVRGYGSSWQPADDGARPCAPVGDTAQALEDVAIATAFIRDQTGADAVDLVGWSWGATVAAAFAAAGNAVGRLVLHAPQWLRDTPSPMVTPQSMHEPYRIVDPAVFVDRWLDRVDAVSRAEMQGWRAAFAATLAQAAPIRVPNGSARDIAAQWMAGIPAYDPAAITVPTLVIVGAADTDTPPTLSRAVFERLGSADKTYAEVPHGTHFTPLEPARAALFDATAAFLAASPARTGETLR